MIRKIFGMIFIVGFILALTGCSNKDECCECLDCPECDVCCDCSNPYMNK